MSPDRLIKFAGPIVAVAETAMQILHPIPAFAENITVGDRTIELPRSAQKYHIARVGDDGLEYMTTIIRNEGLMAVVNEETGELIFVEKPHKIVPSEGAFDFLAEIDPI